jgi:hypothetical protein
MLVAQLRPHVSSRRPPPLDIVETTPAREIGPPGTPSVRDAGAAFVRGTTLGWGRRDLANWLVCHYAPCAVPARGEDRDSRPPALERTLDDGILTRVIVDARVHVLRLLRDLANPVLASPVARLAIASGAVAPRRDAYAGVVYVPVALTRLRLQERAGSLFVADYLNRPHEYGRLVICSGCGELAFTGEIEHVEWCEAAAPQC